MWEHAQRWVDGWGGVVGGVDGWMGGWLGGWMGDSRIRGKPARNVFFEFLSVFGHFARRRILSTQICRLAIWMKMAFFPSLGKTHFALDYRLW